MKKLLGMAVAIMLMTGCASVSKPDQAINQVKPEAYKVTYLCSEFTLGDYPNRTDRPEPQPVHAMQTVIMSDDEVYVPVGDVFTKDRHYYWLDNNPESNKAVNGKLVLGKQQDNIIIFMFKTPFYRGHNDVIGFMLMSKCKPVKP